MKKFEIWMEGYNATGNYSGAQFIGEGFGETFDEAIKDYINKNPNRGIEVNDRSGYVSDEAYKNRRSNWNIWACDLFDNRYDAQKLFR